MGSHQLRHRSIGMLVFCNAPDSRQKMNCQEGQLKLTVWKSFHWLSVNVNILLRHFIKVPFKLCTIRRIGWPWHYIL